MARWLLVFSALLSGQAVAAWSDFAEDRFFNQMRFWEIKCPLDGHEILLREKSKKDRPRLKKLAYEEVGKCVMKQKAAMAEDFHFVATRYPRLKEEYLEIYALWTTVMDGHVANLLRPPAGQQTFRLSINRFLARRQAEPALIDNRAKERSRPYTGRILMDTNLQKSEGRPALVFVAVDEPSDIGGYCHNRRKILVYLSTNPDTILPGQLCWKKADERILLADENGEAFETPVWAWND